MTTTGDTDTDIDICFTTISTLVSIYRHFSKRTELVEAENEERLVDLESEDLRLDE